MIKWLRNALLIVFIALKLAGVITWSWWLVFAPLWIPLLIVIALSAIIGLLVVLVAKEEGYGYA